MKSQIKFHLIKSLTWGEFDDISCFHVFVQDQRMETNGYHPMPPACVSSNGDATAHKVPQKITTPVAEARMAVGKDSSQKIIATEYSKVPDLKAKNVAFKWCEMKFKNVQNLPQVMR